MQPAVEVKVPADKLGKISAGDSRRGERSVLVFLRLYAAGRKARFWAGRLGPGLLFGLAQPS
jgi:hypothetical protein